MTSLKSIDIHDFRGIKELNIVLNGLNLVILGANGTGKSSIIDAIEFFFTGDVDHIGKRKSDLNAYCKNIHSDGSDTNVTLAFDPGDIVVTRQIDQSIIYKDQHKKLNEESWEKPFILRRADILNLIIKNPSNRYEAIGTIIGIDELEPIEKRLKDFYEGRAKDFERIKIEYNNSLMELASLLGVKNDPSLDDAEYVLSLLNKILVEQYGLPELSTFEATDEYQKDLFSNLGGEGAIKGKMAIESVAELLVKVKFSSDTSDSINSLIPDLEAWSREQFQLESDLIQIIKRSLSFVVNRNEDVCPVCEQPIDHCILQARLTQRLNQNKIHIDRETKISNSLRTIGDNLKIKEQGLRELVEKCSCIVDLADEASTISHDQRALSESIVQLFVENGFPTPDEIIALKSLIDSLNQKLEGLNERVSIYREEKLSIDFVSPLSGIDILSSCKVTFEKNVRLKKSLKIAESNSIKAQKIHTFFSEARKIMVQQIYDAINGEIKDYYSIMHPDDPHSDIRLNVSMGKNKSTELTMSIMGRTNENPSKLISEGHLDSLGLCIFLAFVKKFNEDAPIIILDDVITTLDSGHRWHFCKLIHQHFLDKQLIITTSDGIWYEQLKSYQRAYGLQAKFRHKVIYDWSLETGPKILDYKPKWEIVDEKLDRGDKNGAANEGRQYLEYILKQICRDWEAKVPFRDDQKFTVADIFEPAKSRASKLIADETYAGSINATFRIIEATQIVGNMLSHSNNSNELLTLEEVKEFCNAVHDLDGLLTCAECGSKIEYFRGLKILRCANPKCIKPFIISTK